VPNDLAQSPRIFAKMFAGGLLDKGPLSLRQREIVIADPRNDRAGRLLPRDQLSLPGPGAAAGELRRTLSGSTISRLGFRM
jgi:hypothetical protein